MVVYNFHNPQPFASTQPSYTLFATKSVTYPFASTISTPLTNFQNFTYNTLPLPIKPLTFPLLTSHINFAEGNFGNCRFQRHQNVCTFYYYIIFLSSNLLLHSGFIKIPISCQNSVIILKFVRLVFLYCLKTINLYRSSVLLLVL